MSNKRLAKKGRYGDTRIRKVDGRKSHVNKREADMIDIYGLLGEIFAKQQGAGTINPKTGLPEYHGKLGISKKKHPRHHTLLEILNPLEHIPVGGGETVMTSIEEGLGLESTAGKQGQKLWEQGSELVGDIKSSLMGWGVDDGGGDEELSPEPGLPDPTSTSYGAGSISAGDFTDAEGNMLPFEDVVQVFQDKFPGSNPSEIQQLVSKEMPNFQQVAQQEKDFLGDQRGISENIAGLKKTKAGDAYSLATGAVGREEEAFKEQYDLGISAAERGRGAAQDVYGAAEDVYGAAQEAHTLGQSAAERGLQGTLGQLQQQAGQLGAGMRSAYGGMGGGMRGAMGAQATMAKGLGQTYDAYADQQTALSGALGRAESTLGRAQSAGTRAMGAYADEETRLLGAKTRGLAAATDERTRLSQELGYVTGEGLPEGMLGEYDISMSEADLAERQGLYGLQKGAEGTFESQLGDFISSEQFKFKKGGKVPTFLDVLNTLPDAGGS